MSETYETFGGFPRGCHGTLAPSNLASGYFHRGVNVSVRGGQVRTRPRWQKDFDLQGAGPFQGAFVYSLNDGDRVVYGRGGKVRVLELWTGVDVEVGSLSDSASCFYFTQADRYCVVQDGTTRPLILHESSLLRQAAPYDGTGPSEVYTGTVMAYGHGKLFLSPTKLHDTNGQPLEETGRPYWVAGGQLRAQDPERLLIFDDTQYLNGGTAASLPFESGYVQGLAFFQNVASGTGLGPLLVFGRRGVSAVAVNVPRDSWYSADFSQVLFIGPGTISPRSLVPVNNDLMFRSLDGIRSVRLTSQSSASNSDSPLAVVPMSQEVQHRLDEDDAEALTKTSAAFADNRVLMTTSKDGEGFKGVVSIDTAPTSASGGASAPAFDDLWTGPEVHQVLSANGPRGLPTPRAVVTTEEGLALASLSEDALKDFDQDAPISRVYLPAASGRGARTVNDFVKFNSVRLSFRDVRGPLKVRAYYRADEYPRWSATDEFSWGGSGEDAFSLAGVTLGGLDPLTGHTAGNGLPFGVGRNIQVCIEWEGVATLVGCLVEMEKTPVDVAVTQTCAQGFCETEDPPDTVGALVTLDDYNYQVVPAS
jgi:hypothetical protein